MEVAVIGSRKPGRSQRILCESFTKTLLKLGFIVRTGAAVGIDEIAMSIAKDKCSVFLPWTSYNGHLIAEHKPSRIIVYNEKHHPDWLASVNIYHPNPEYLTQGARSLHARNYGIILYEKPVNLVIAFPSVDGGGTAQGIRIARDHKVPLIQFKESCGWGGAELVTDTFIKVVKFIVTGIPPTK